MKLSRTKEHHFGWLAAIPLLDVTFLLIFFLLLSSNFILQPGISVSVPLSRFTLGPQINPQIIPRFSTEFSTAFRQPVRTSFHRQFHNFCAPRWPPGQ